MNDHTICRRKPKPTVSRREIERIARSAGKKIEQVIKVAILAAVARRKR